MQNTVLMCRPSYFEVNYCINPWMGKAIVNQAKAFKQWHDLVKVFQLLNIKVNIIEQERHLSDMVFSTDCGFVYKKTFIPANYTYPQRKLEKFPYFSWFSLNSFQVQSIPDRCHFEGGDCIFADNQIFLGTGFRSHAEAAKFISQITSLPTTCLKLINSEFYHLDTCFLYINPHTALYYSKAFDQKSKNLLKKKFTNLISITKTEASTLITNSVIFNQNIITPSQINQRLYKLLIHLGFNIFNINVDEFAKAGGGIHCLTNIFYH